MAKLPGPTIGPRGLRWVLGAVTALLALTLVTPLWVTTLEAPQYHDEEELQVKVWAGRVSGDLDEIGLLNQYVGVQLPLDTPELLTLPWVLGALVVAAAVSLWLPGHRRYQAAILLLGLMLTSVVVGAGVLQRRLFQLGHDRGRQVLEGVPDFSPPVFGRIHVANFDALMVPGLGGWAFVVAVILLAWAILATDPRATDAPGPPTRTPGQPTQTTNEDLLDSARQAQSSDRSMVELLGKLDRRQPTRIES